MTGQFNSFNQESTKSRHEPADFIAQPNRRVRGQRRVCPDRRKANLLVQNCRRKSVHERRGTVDRRPESSEQREILRTVPVKKQFVVPGSAPKVGSIINISV